MLLSMATTISQIENSHEESIEDLPDYQIPDSTASRAASDWEWSTSFGSTESDDGWGIVVDQDYTSYVTGQFRGTVNFGSCSTCTQTSQGNSDIFIAKLDPQGDFLWVNTAGGSAQDAPIGHITQLANGNLAIAGYVGGGAAQFDSIQLNPTGVRGMLIATFDQTGNWIWATEYSGAHSTSDVRAYDIASDDSHIYVTGDFVKSMVVNGVTHNAFTTGVSAGAKDLFVMKSDYSGSHVWSQFSIGGKSHDGGRGIAVDSNENVYIAGLHSEDAPFGSTTLVTNPTGSSSVYNKYEALIAKLDPNGNWLWATSHYGPHDDIARDIVVTQDALGVENIVATIWATNDLSISSTNNIISGPFNNLANHMVVTSKFNTDGEMMWYDVVTGYDNNPAELTTGPSGDIFVCGYGTNLGSMTSHHSDQQYDDQWNTPLDDWAEDMWVAKYETDGRLDWVVTSGADPAESTLRDCALNQDNVPYLAGGFDGDSVYSTSHPDSDGTLNAGLSPGAAHVRDGIFGKLIDDYATVNPEPCEQFNGMLGPVWDNSTTNNLVAGDIYEHPEGSGLYWQVINSTNSNADPGTNPDIWSEACTCYEIWSSTSSPVVWDVVGTYDLYDIVEYPAGSYQLWHAVDNVPANEIPDDPNNWRFWQACEGTECAQFNGILGPVWNSSTSNFVNPGDIYEFPANSGIFWIVNPIHTPGFTAADPGTNPDIWSLDCNCTEIWNFNGQPTWDSTQVYSQFEIIESPTGSGDLWSPNVANVLGGMSPEFSMDWDGCGDPLTPCEEAASLNNNWPIWTVSGPPYDVGDVVSYGNEFYISIRLQNTIEPGPLGVQALAWIECTCDDIKSQLPDYQSANSYSEFDGVVYNNEVYWAISSVPAGASPGPNQYWRTCDWCDSSNNNLEGEWDINTAFSANYMIGDLVTQNGVIWVSIMNHNPTVPSGGVVVSTPPGPIIFTIMWDVGWVQCDCNEVATTYDSTVTYQEGDIVVGPDGNTWISEYSNNNIWPSIEINLPWMVVTIPTWRMCSPSDCNNPQPWSQLTANLGGYFAGDIVSHVGNTWQLMSGYSGSSIAPSVSMNMNPGPWTPCNPVAVSGGPVSMYIISQGEVNIETKNIQSITRNTVDTDDEIAGPEPGTKFSSALDPWLGTNFESAILLKDGITEIEDSSLENLVENRTLIVDVCDPKYNLNSYNEQRYLCGFWYEDSGVNAMGENTSTIILGPRLLCPIDMPECHDIILKIDVEAMVSDEAVVIDSNEESTEVVSDDSTNDTRVPGFSAIMLVICMIFSALVISRRP